mmetsp:Transcript_61912/g.109730  ORF Transcript_61912/g.109730 Transcript_61912/m.109730 type:complete len:217 (-) Transcript_61912:3-653(-)
MVEQRDGPDNGPLLLALLWEIRRIAHDNFRARDYVLDSDALTLAVRSVLHLEIIWTKDRFSFKIAVQHVGASMHCSQSRKSLWKLSQSIQGIQIWRSHPSEGCHGIQVQLHSRDNLHGWFTQVRIITVECARVGEEFNRGRLQFPVLEELGPCHFVDLKRRLGQSPCHPCFRIICDYASYPMGELGHSRLLHHPHERRLHRVGGSGRELTKLFDPA